MDQYIPNKRPKPEWNTTSDSAEEIIEKNHGQSRQQKPQLWIDEILTWEQTVVRMWETNKKESIDMLASLETTLGPMALGIWQSKKNQDPTKK
ncbi:hypothetical protein R6Q57_008324 [Mikania cordata]